jgi:hypothetical protein
MRIPTWRLALTGGAIAILLALGVGLVAASSTPAGDPGAAAAAAPSVGPNAATPNGPNPNAPGNHPLLRQRLERLLGRAASGPGLRHLVDGRLTYTDQSGALVTIQLDHGTIASIGSDSITISEAGGGRITVSTDGDTVVRLGGGAGLGKLGDLKVGDEVVVQSRVDGATTLAKHVLRVPAAAASGTSSSSTNG